MRRQERRGFTLIEVIVVLIIIGILAAIAVPSIFSWITKSYSAQAVQQLESIKDALVPCLQANNGDGVNCLYGINFANSAYSPVTLPSQGSSGSCAPNPKGTQNYCNTCSSAMPFQGGYTYLLCLMNHSCTGFAMSDTGGLGQGNAQGWGNSPFGYCLQFELQTGDYTNNTIGAVVLSANDQQGQVTTASCYSAGVWSGVC